MLSKLEQLGTDTLKKMQERITEILNSRLDTRPMVGRIGTIVYEGALTTLRVERINQKTISCVEISPLAGRNWRVSHSQLKIEPVERKVATPLKQIETPYKPSSVAEDAW